MSEVNLVLYNVHLSSLYVTRYCFNILCLFHNKPEEKVIIVTVYIRFPIINSNSKNDEQ
jgi:hypothetical protein